MAQKRIPYSSSPFQYFASNFFFISLSSPVLPVDDLLIRDYLSLIIVFLCKEMSAICRHFRKTFFPKAVFLSIVLRKTNLPENNLPENNLHENNLHERNLPESDLPESDLPESDLLKDNSAEDLSPCLLS